MSNFTDALSAFIAAHQEHAAAGRNARLAQGQDYVDPEAGARLLDYVDATAQALAQAGDVLERELRQIMRDEVTKVVRLDAVL